MSLQANWNAEIPADTAQLGREILSENDPYRLVGDGVNGFLSLKDFISLYSNLRCGAICPIILSLVTVFQFLESIPDRVAARWAVTRIDWKYALHLPLAWLGFNFSDLSNFRKRLLERKAEWLIFEKVLSWVRSLGFVKKYGKQRSDSSHILGCVERLSRLELVWETLRVALRAIKAAAPEWYEEVIRATFHEAYVKRQSDWRLTQEEVKAKMREAGSDGFWLLDRLDDRAPQGVLDLPEVATLRTVWEQQFERQAHRRKVVVRQPPIKGKDIIQSPHDSEARLGADAQARSTPGPLSWEGQSAPPGPVHRSSSQLEAVGTGTGGPKTGRGQGDGGLLRSTDRRVACLATGGDTSRHLC